jgi:hypothetical protein
MSRLIINGLTYAISVHAAACSPGVFVKKSRQRPKINPSSESPPLEILKGSQSINRKYRYGIDKSMKRFYIILYKYLEEYKYNETDNIFKQVAHQSFFTFFKTESISAFCRF